MAQSKLNRTELQIKFKQGTAANINTTATKNAAVEGEPHWTTDTDQLYVFDGTQNVRVPTADLNGDVQFDDSDKIVLGTGSDAKIYYDGSDLIVDVDDVAASDFVLKCGSQKTLTLDSVVWDDQQVNISSVKLPTSNAPSWTAYQSSQVLAFSSITDNTIYFTAQLPHRYKLGSDIEFHIHYALPVAGAGGGAENVKWDFTHSWSDIGEAIPAATTVNKTIDVQALSADTHYLGDIATTITGTNMNLSSILLCSLKRDTTVANDYASDVYLLALDFHYQIDTMGSRQEVVK